MNYTGFFWILVGIGCIKLSIVSNFFLSEMIFDFAMILFFMIGFVQLIGMDKNEFKEH